MQVTSLAFSILLYSISILFICAPSANAWNQLTTPKEYFIPFQGGQTHAFVYGTPVSGRPTLILLHGGPGLSSDYMLPISDLYDRSGIPVIVYDQIGNGRSSHYPNAPSSFWTLDLFLNELQNLVNYFTLSNYSLLGHSWGSELALEFAVQRQPAGLTSLILSDGLASMDLYGKSLKQLLKKFPASVQQGMANGFNDPVAFEAAFRTFFAVHGCRLVPTPKQENDTLQYIFGPNADPTVAKAIGITPPDWSIIDRLSLVSTPTLVLNGQYSVSKDFVIAPFLEFIDHVKYRFFSNSSQMAWFEEPATFFENVAQFLSNPTMFPSK